MGLGQRDGNISPSQHSQAMCQSLQCFTSLTRQGMLHLTNFTLKITHRQVVTHHASFVWVLDELFPWKWVASVYSHLYAAGNPYFTGISFWEWLK